MGKEKLNKCRRGLARVSHEKRCVTADEWRGERGCVSWEGMATLWEWLWAWLYPVSVLSQPYLENK